MSIDYIFVKSLGNPESIEQIVEDTNYRLDNYKALAQKFFPSIVWDAWNFSFIDIEGTSIEVCPSDSSLSLYFRGLNSNPGIVFSLIGEAKKEGVVLIDVQSSQIVHESEAGEDVQIYLDWYKTVLKNY